MRLSLRQLDSRRTLHGWVVLAGNEIDLALNYGPSLCGYAWGFDYINRATVFPTKTAACKALKVIGNEDKRRSARVISVCSVATMRPSVDKRGRIVWHARDKNCSLTLKDYANNWEKNAVEAEQKAQEMLKRALQLRRNAKKLMERVHVES